MTGSRNTRLMPVATVAATRWVMWVGAAPPIAATLIRRGSRGFTPMNAL